jgi:hypothetical protein
MNIKSLLIGSAALATVSTGAQAADAIVMADPEPMEYVRICDVYGAGFFYIPGTETCLAIGGYMRYQVNINAAGFTKLARFAPRFDVRSDTEIGTIRGFAEVEIDWGRAANRLNPATGAIGAGYGTDVNLAHGFVQLIRGSHRWRFGVTHNPYTRFLGYGVFGISDQNIGFRQTGEISYTFLGSNGLGFIFALVEDQDTNFTPDIEVGLRYAAAWGHVGIAGVADFDGTGFRNAGNAAGFVAYAGHRVKGSLLLNFGNSGVSMKTQAAYNISAGTFEAALGFQAVFSPKVTGYINAGLTTTSQVNSTLGMVFQPTGTNAFQIQPEVTYNFTTGAFGGTVRFNRNFGGGAGD